MGKLTHACMSDDNLFKKGKSIIAKASIKGLFDNVKFIKDINLPPDTPDSWQGRQGN